MATLLSESQVLHHIAYHIFLPPQLPQQAPSDDHEQQINLELTTSVICAARRYEAIIEPNDRPQWTRMIRTLQRLNRNIEIPLEKNHLSLKLKYLDTNG